ncbi:MULTISPECIES: hypothetical protein [unclassified Streptomyces]|uniref:hypothetical protein n=1 Tax=unclassified Streptomyces TaxID=2593676 RepID=UPI000A56862B|nr:MULTISPECIES: hypothetical protein [unclassified Streptomyces]
MDAYSDEEILVLFDALDEQKYNLKHHPSSFTFSEIDVINGLWQSFLDEARHRKIIL